MKKYAKGSLGIIGIAALFGFVALLVGYFILGFSGMASFVVGLIVAFITAIVLWMSGEDGGETGTVSDAVDMPDPKTDVATAASAAPTVAETPDPEPVPMPDPAPAPEPVVEPVAEPEPVPAPTSVEPEIIEPKNIEPKAVEPEAVEPKTQEPAPVAADGKPEFLSAARAEGADDLKQIKGVGPKLEALLNSMGVFHFDQIAGWRAEEVAWVDENLEGFRGRVSRDEWVAQSKVLAQGGTTEFSKKVKKGGVY